MVDEALTPKPIRSNCQALNWVADLAMISGKTYNITENGSAAKFRRLGGRRRRDKVLQKRKRRKIQCWRKASFVKGALANRASFIRGMRIHLSIMASFIFASIVFVGPSST